jgi:uncharacterized protein
MTAVFADTSYFLALINANDDAHQRAAEFSESHDAVILTTAWVLTELANALARSSHRSVFLRILDGLEADETCTIIPPGQPLHEQGIQLYRARPDKDWSLTDCISFIVMQQYGLADALTADHHFEQAGFGMLLV